MNFLLKMADHRCPDSWASQLRRRRFELWSSLVNRLPKPVTVLDVGGEESFWKRLGPPDDGIRIVLLNLVQVKTTLPNVESIAGDATNLSEFADNSFDVVHSNSVIEHLFTWQAQEKMAKEIQRVGKRYFVQTPNRYFPIEPHFHVPLFQFFPLQAKIFLMQRMALGGYMKQKAESRDAAESLAREMRLLTRSEFTRLFPGAEFYEERFMGMAKSFIAYGGWDRD